MAALCRIVLLVMLLSVIVLSGAGCRFFHELQPHRLGRWNHGIDGMKESQWD